MILTLKMTELFFFQTFILPIILRKKDSLVFKTKKVIEQDQCTKSVLKT